MRFRPYPRGQGIGGLEVSESLGFQGFRVQFRVFGALGL